MNDGNNLGMQTILAKINTLAGQKAGEVASDGALESYINKLMGEEKNLLSLSPTVKGQFRQELLVRLKGYIAAKKSLSARDQLLSFADTLAEFKDTYQGMISPPMTTKRKSMKNKFSPLPPAPVA